MSTSTRVFLALLLAACSAAPGGRSDVPAAEEPAPAPCGDSGAPDAPRAPLTMCTLVEGAGDCMGIEWTCYGVRPVDPNCIVRTPPTVAQATYCCP
jgi:hypothetical protein